jgi:acyl-coenzyme A thioesterase PaaI-like protein
VSPPPSWTSPAGPAPRRTFEDTDAGFLATVDLDVTYLNPATGDPGAEVAVAHAGGWVGVTEAEATSPDGDGESTPVAVGTTAYRPSREGFEDG